MSEDIVIGTGTEKILGTYADAVAYVDTMLGARYDAWIAKDPIGQKKSLVNAVRYFNAQVWTEEADTFAKRDALQVNGKYVFREAQAELAVLILENTELTDAADQGSNIQNVSAGGASVSYFNSTTKGAPPLPPVLMRMIGSYLTASTASMPASPRGQSGACVNPFSSSADPGRGKPY